MADVSHSDTVFSQFSWAFLNFAADHHAKIDKHWHGFDSWRFSFRHSKGGAACIEVFREVETGISVSAYWWDDYANGTRSATVFRSETRTVDSFEMSNLLEQTLREVVAWPVNSWTNVTEGWDYSWKKDFTKEHFEL